MDRSSTGGTVWGVGPAFVLPTATDDSLGQDKWAAGLLPDHETKISTFSLHRSLLIKM
jgi:hypothetical protein